MKEFRETKFGNGRANQSGMQDPDLVVARADDPRWGALRGRRHSTQMPVRTFGLGEILGLMTPAELHNDSLRTLDAGALDDKSIPEAS